MEKKTFSVPNMTCNGCVSSVRSELESLSGVEVVDINKPAQLVTVQWESPANWDQIGNALVEINYAPVETSSS
jgi:copper chaperone